MNDSKYFDVEANCIDDVWRMVDILAEVPEIMRERMALTAQRPGHFTYQVKGTFEERKAAYRKVRRLGRGKVRFSIVPKSLECIHGGAWSRQRLARTLTGRDKL